MTKQPNSMIPKGISSAFVHTFQGLSFWSGISSRNLLIASMRPKAESGFTEALIGLCVLANVSLPFIAGYFIAQAIHRLGDQTAVFLLSISVWFLGVVGFAFYRRVLVWPRQSRPVAETAQAFEVSAYSILATKGWARWKLIGLSLVQTAIMGAALFQIATHGIDGVLMVYVSIWLPAIVVIALAIMTTNSFFAGNEYFTAVDKALLAIRVSTDLTVVAMIIVGVATMAVIVFMTLLYLAVLAIAALILWVAFAAYSGNASSLGELFSSSEKKTTNQWRDTSGATHVDGDGQIRQSHTGSLLGNIDAAGRVTDTSGDYKSQAHGEGNRQ